MKSKNKKINYPKENIVIKRKAKKRKHIEIEGSNEPRSKFKKSLKLPDNLSSNNIKINSFIEKNFNIKKEYLNIDNQLDYCISIPQETLFIKNEKKYFDNYYFYYQIIKHKDINNVNINEIEINHDGNCFYNCLSFFFYWRTRI